MFKPDRPIEKFKDDILGTGPFAQALGEAILKYASKESVVVGLYGPWGTGKTSIINIALEHIENLSKESDNKPVIMRFNPWNFSEQNQLLNQFFEQLSRLLDKADWAQDFKEAGKRLKLYANCLKPLAIIPGIGQLATVASGTLEQFGNTYEKIGESKSEDLASIKDELRGILGKQSHKIIVVIDDIDRLNNVEIRQIFQLVKCLGDFPNTIYLLAFDKDIVTEALKGEQGDLGEKYLEKVVQVPREVPAISKYQVVRLLESEINKVIKGLPQDKWDEMYMVNMYHSGLRDFFRTVRDVRRFINSLVFSFGLISQETNLVDLIAITAIQVFEPAVYDGIKNNKDLFANELHDNQEWKKQAKERCDEIIERCSRLKRERLEELLKRLFPTLESVYGNIFYGGESQQNWRKLRRICSPDVFDFYFRLCVPEGEIPQTEMERIISLADDKESFEREVRELNKNGRAVRFTERLLDYADEKLGKEKIEGIVSVLINIGDTFPKEKRGFYDLGTAGHVFRACYFLIEGLKERKERFEILKEAVENAKESIYTAAYLVHALGWDHGKHTQHEAKPENERIVNADELAELERIACAKIEEWARDGRLSKHPDFTFLLFSLEDWGNAEKVHEYVESVVSSDEDLINVLCGFVQESHRQPFGDYGFRTEYRIDIKTIGRFLDVSKIEQRIRKIAISNSFKDFTEERKRGVNAFLESIDKKEK